VNSGLRPLASYTTLVCFGDSYTDGGTHDGSPLKPAVVIPPNPQAGGRASDGPVWAEDIVNDTKAILKDYARGGAVTNVTLWPSKAGQSDFITQVALFLNQSNNLNPNTTLYSVFFGINDNAATGTDGTANLPLAAQTIINEITLLTQAPTNARSFLVIDDYGFGSETVAGDAFKKQYFNGLATLQQQIPGFRVAFVDLKTLWSGVLTASPGFAAFGYTSKANCLVNSTSTVGECSDPDHTFYWIPSHPSKQTHRIMADYIEAAVLKCNTS